ncbi:MAG: hypothetical protein U5N53_00640 [Mycobacterium sp.]|nr:hypothetical protein [Mycobacterium sp.]
MKMNISLIAALTLFCVGNTAQADGLSGLGAKLVELSGGKAPVTVLAPGTKLNISGHRNEEIGGGFRSGEVPR